MRVFFFSSRPSVETHGHISKLRRSQRILLFVVEWNEIKKRWYVQYTLGCFVIMSEYRQKRFLWDNFQSRWHFTHGEDQTAWKGSFPSDRKLRVKRQSNADHETDGNTHTATVHSSLRAIRSFVYRLDVTIKGRTQNTIYGTREARLEVIQI